VGPLEKSAELPGFVLSLGIQSHTLKKIFLIFYIFQRFYYFYLSTSKVEAQSFKDLERQSLSKGSRLLARRLKTQLLKPSQRFFFRL